MKPLEIYSSGAASGTDEGKVFSGAVVTAAEILMGRLKAMFHEVGLHMRRSWTGHTVHIPEGRLCRRRSWTSLSSWKIVCVIPANHVFRGTLPEQDLQRGCGAPFKGRHYAVRRQKVHEAADTPTEGLWGTCPHKHACEGIEGAVAPAAS